MLPLEANSGVISFPIEGPATLSSNKACKQVSSSTHGQTLPRCVNIQNTLCAKLVVVRTMLQSTKNFETKLVRYIEWSNVQPWVHHISPIWPNCGHFGPKNSHIWPYLAIGSPSCPKLVEHWLNMVEHRSPHQSFFLKATSVLPNFNANWMDAFYADWTDPEIVLADTSFYLFLHLPGLKIDSIWYWYQD